MSSNIEQLFDLHRFQSQQEFPKILLYFPVGLFLLLFRLLVCFLTWPFFWFLPKTSKLRNFLIKGICFLFGVFVKQDVFHRDEKVKLLICNHISVLDHIIVDSILNCTQVDNCSCLFMPSLSYFQGVDSPNDVISHTANEFQRYDLSVIIFPEGAMTNGKVGLLKFNSWPFATTLPIQPVVIQVSNVSVISISPSVLGTSVWCDLLWLLFVPYTAFTLTVLPSIVKNENESTDDFSKRAQAYMASSLNLTPTIYTLQDKDEYEKHLAALPASTAETLHSTQQHSIRENEYSPEINRMAGQVKEILPDVPFTIIQQDIGITQSVDETILRILEGIVHYVPDINSLARPTSFPNSSSSCLMPFNSITNCDSGVETLPSLNTAVKTFGKTSKERMMSYHERKAALMMAARIRYFKTHGLT